MFILFAWELASDFPLCLCTTFLLCMSSRLSEQVYTSCLSLGFAGLWTHVYLDPMSV